MPLGSVAKPDLQLTPTAGKEETDINSRVLLSVCTRDFSPRKWCVDGHFDLKGRTWDM